MTWAHLRQALPEDEIGFQTKCCVIPIWPRYAQLIYDGVKRYEFRKLLPRPDTGAFLVYETAPISKITGFFLSEHILQKAPHELWQMTAAESGILEKDFFHYFRSHKSGAALLIKSARKFLSPVALGHFGCKPPQSYVYI